MAGKYVPMFQQKMGQMLSNKEYGILLAFCKEQMDFYPEDPDVLFYYASVLEALGKHADAKNAFEKLFRITHDRLFLLCETIPGFREGKAGEAKEALEKEIAEDSKAENLFFAFEVAAKNGQAETANLALLKAFRRNPKKTLGLLQGFFEGAKERSIEKRMLFITILSLLKSAGERS